MSLHCNASIFASAKSGSNFAASAASSPPTWAECKTSSRPSRCYEHDPDPAFTVQAVTEELHSILDELKDSLKPKELSRYTDELM